VEQANPRVLATARQEPTDATLACTRNFHESATSLPNRGSVLLPFHPPVYHPRLRARAGSVFFLSCRYRPPLASRPPSTIVALLRPIVAGDRDLC